MTSKRLLLLIITLLILTFGAFSDTAATDDFLEVKVAFIGPADPIYSWWGHVAVIIENKASGAAKAYDYGNFSFDQDSFVRNFIMGRLYFLKAASNPARLLKYNAFLNRDITVYTLDISLDKKLELYKFLENDILPENRVYLYDHFYDNCATRIRDLMNLVTDGQFDRTYDVPSDKTLRTQLRRSSYSSPFMDWLLNFALHAKTDAPATELEGMYLPMELERGVASLIVTDTDGNTRPFVKNIDIYNRAEGRAKVLDYPPPRWQYGLAVGLILGAAALLLKKNENRSRIKLRAVSLFSAVLSLVLAVPGSLLFFMAFFTDHYYTFWNMNLLFVNPFLFVTFAFSIGKLIRKNTGGGLSRCWMITAAGAGLSIIMKMLPACRQENWETILIVLPAALVLSGIPQQLILRIKSGRQPINAAE